MPFDAFNHLFGYDNYDEYMSTSSTSGGSHNNLIFDDRLKTAPDGMTIAADVVSKMLWGKNATAKDFIDYLIKNISSSSSSSPQQIITQKMCKCVLTEKDAEKIADRAADWAVSAIARDHCLTDIITDSTYVAQYLLDEMVGYILWVLSDEYDFRVGAMDEKDGVDDAVATICAMIDWGYIWEEIDQLAHSLLIRMTVGILRHVETTIKDSM